MSFWMFIQKPRELMNESSNRLDELEKQLDCRRRRLNWSKEKRDERPLFLMRWLLPSR